MTKSPRKKPSPAPAPQAPNRWQWITRPWAVTVAVCAAVGAFLLNINPILSNVRQLPSEVQKTSDQFSSWYYQDDAWSGYWINNPEGYVDAEDMKLSREKMAIDIKVTNGVIDGTIATPQICASIPFFDYLLVRGNVNATRTSARVIVWDVFMGQKQDVAALELKRDGAVLSVVPKEGVVRLFPKARIARDPGDQRKPEAEFCEGKPEAIAKMVEQLLKEQGAAAPHADGIGRSK